MLWKCPSPYEVTQKDTRRLFMKQTRLSSNARKLPQPLLIHNYWHLEVNWMVTQGRGPVLSQPHIGVSQPQDDGKQTSLLTLGPSTFLVSPKSHLLTEGQGRSQRASSGTSFHFISLHHTEKKRYYRNQQGRVPCAWSPLSICPFPHFLAVPLSPPGDFYIPHLFLRKSTLPVVLYLCLENSSFYWMLMEDLIYTCLETDGNEFQELGRRWSSSLYYTVLNKKLQLIDLHGIQEARPPQQSQHHCLLFSLQIFPVGLRGGKHISPIHMA
ncbi:hypothetical protein HJG60_011903 [Phyllostomus discolor]|uniref:Uncharacterized protein n=1 Tax=Phyllostomus discolor TaxID=89673 RepID=A0A833ZLD2_9CHIR|nr:hypothetical protein HJG60_011903 [Phyllostomus discolor]